MTLALLVETQNGELSQQTLIFPHNGEVRTYHRDSTGQAGRGQTWERVSDTACLPSTLLIHNPVAVLLTERDTALIEGGLVTNIGAKALYALDSAEPISAPTTHRESVEDIIARLYAGDNSL